MAKRTRSQANDGASASPSRPKSRRTRPNPAPEPDTIGSYPGVERSEDDDVRPNAAAGEGEGTISPAPQTMDTMRGEPSDEDIRRRAYERYLERGANHGLDFEDWLEAERELKRSRNG